jgi:hypothetical protein
MTTARSGEYPRDLLDGPRCPRSPLDGKPRWAPRPIRIPVLLILTLAGCSAAAPREDVEPLFRTLETGSSVEALAASEKLASAYDDSELPRLASALDAAPVRTLMLIGELSTEGSAKLLVDRLPYLLESKDREVARMAAVAAGLRRLRQATESLLHHPEEPAVIRALGRIWAQTLEAPPLPRAEEIDRLTVLAVAHRQAMGPGSTLEACEAMLSVTTSSELADFLSKHAGDKFFARRLCEEAVRRPGFDSEKGLHIHEALLANPDPDLVAAILSGSSFPLREELVRGFLQDKRTTSKGEKLSELADQRLRR